MIEIRAMISILLASTASLSWVQAVMAADAFVGRASVNDCDTIEIHGVRIRLWGTDAPESTQLCRGEDGLPYRCGAEAANALDAFIGNRPVNCAPRGLARTRTLEQASPCVAQHAFARG